MIKVEIWSDFACPFCYIGKTHFEQALSKFEKREQVQIVYRSFELDPRAPKSQSQSIYEVLAKKYGQSIEWAQNANQRVIQMGQQCGLQFQMEKIVPTNSFDAHRLDHLAQEKNKQAAWQDSVFRAYFSEGLDIAKEEELVKLGLRCGLLETEIRGVLDSHHFSEEVRQDEAQAQEYGISGVPFFLFNQEVAVSGAQPAEVFLQALQEL